MFYANSSGIGQILVVDCERGDNLTESILKALRENGIENAVILSGVATFDQLHYHYVANTDLDPKEHHRHENGAFEVSNISGFILQGIPHIHFTAHDLNRNKTVAAHLEPDTTVLYVAELVLAEILNLSEFTRVSYPDKKIVSST